MKDRIERDRGNDYFNKINSGDIKGSVFDNWYNETSGQSTSDGQSAGVNQAIRKAIRLIFNHEQSGDLQFTIDEILTDFSELLSQNLGDDHDRDLIDTIANALQQSRGSNFFSGKTLTTLRKAILIPEELIGLKNRLANGELGCGTCGADLKYGDMLTLTKESGDSTVVVCSNCVIPKFVHCGHTKGCTNSIEIPSRTRSTLSKLAGSGCNICKQKDKEKLVEDGDPVGGGSIDLNDIPTPVLTSRVLDPVENDNDDNAEDGDDEWLPEDSSEFADTVNYFADLDNDGINITTTGTTNPPPTFISSTPTTAEPPRYRSWTDTQRQIIDENTSRQFAEIASQMGLVGRGTQDNPFRGNPVVRGNENDEPR